MSKRHILSEIDSKQLSYHKPHTLDSKGKLKTEKVKEETLGFFDEDPMQEEKETSAIVEEVSDKNETKNTLVETEIDTEIVGEVHQVDETKVEAEIVEKPAKKGNQFKKKSQNLT